MRRILTPALILASLLAVATTAADEESLRKVGEARLKVMFWTIYESRLYTADGDYRAGQRPLRLEVEYLMDIPSDKLVERTGKEWDAMGLELPQRDAWLEQLGLLFPDIDEGDVLSLRAGPDGTATLVHNGKRRGNIMDRNLVQAFLDIWLSEETTRPELRLALIGAED